MPLLNLYNKGNATIAVWHITESESQLLEQLHSSSYHKKAIEDIKTTKRRLEYLSTRLLLQNIIPGLDLQVKYLDSGKPYLHNSDSYISISHTSNYAAVIYHPSAEVGIDIEYFSDKPSRLAKRFLSNNEIKQLQDQDKYVEGSLLAWSAKESMFKIMPDSNIDFRDHLFLDLSIIDKEGVLKSQELRSDNKLAYNVNYSITQEFVLTYIISEVTNE